MKKITLYNIDKTIYSIIRKRAKKDKTSLNRTVQNILSEKTGIYGKIIRNDFDEFVGLWNSNDYKMFNKNISDFENID
jgi:hypothetical protein